MPSSTDAALDPRIRSALARLTDNEKACLRRRLKHQTAKEMAIELGVSPHAVEKRLKMARAKLGVSSSLHAARLLATAEAGYQSLAPQSSDLADKDETGQSKAVRLEAIPTTSGAHRSRKRMMGTLMLITTIAAAAMFAGAAEQSREAPKTQPTFEQMFEKLDRDRSGFIEAAEYPKVIGVQPGGENFFTSRDSNKDGKVSLAELSAGASIRIDPTAEPVLLVRQE